MAASILQRNPVVMRPLSEIEAEYHKYRSGLEAERACGVFHIPSARDEQQASPTQRRPTVEETVVSTGETEDLRNANVKSLARHLHRKLYFCLQDRHTGTWTLPMTRFTQSPDESSLHQLAQSHLAHVLGGSTGLELYHVGAAPVAFHMVRFHDRTSAPIGRKHFFFRSQLVAGKVRVSDEVADYGWFLKEELQGRLPGDYFASIEAVVSE